MIISALETYRLDSSHSLKEIITYYQPIVFDSKDMAPIEMNNKYFVMLYNDDVSDRKSLVDRKYTRFKFLLIYIDNNKLKALL